MRSFVQELSDKEILSEGDILKLKIYIAHKYKDTSSSDRAKILANAVHRVVNSNLPELDVDERTSIRKKLIDKTLRSSDHRISLYDIFDCCISLETKSKNFINHLVNWINLNVDNKITDYELHKYSNNNIAYYSRPLEFDNEPVINNSDTLSIITPNSQDISKRFNGFRYTVCLTLAIIIFLFNFLLLNIPYTTISHTAVVTSNPYISDYLKYSSKQRISDNEPIPVDFRFKKVNKQSLKEYLLAKKSLLGKEPYFSTIISIAKNYNLNPLILFAVAGQEQGFVPQFQATSKTIANNPFNVYHSWKEYNTNITDATKIVCTTILNLSRNRPSKIEPFAWINRKYAEDQNWAHGVRLIFDKLEKISGTVTKD